MASGPLVTLFASSGVSMWLSGLPSHGLPQRRAVFARYQELM